MPKPREADILSTNLGSMVAITPQTNRGYRWLRKHVPDSAGWETTYTDHRCGVEILYGAKAAGLTLEDGETGRRA